MPIHVKRVQIMKNNNSELKYTDCHYVLNQQHFCPAALLWYTFFPRVNSYQAVFIGFAVYKWKCQYVNLKSSDSDSWFAIE